MRDVHALAGVDVVVDGVRMHVADHGPAPCPLPLLLLHGPATSSYLWRDVARDLEHSERCLMPDLVGLGASEAPADPRHYPLAAQAERLVGLLDRLDIERVAVAGHDLGGSIAIHLAALAPERVAAIALLAAPLHADGWPPNAVRPWLMPLLGPTGIALLRRRPSAAAALLRKATGTDLSDEECAHYLAPLRTADGARGFVTFLRSVDLGATPTALRLIGDLPTLVLWGEHDPMRSAAYGRRVAAAIPGATWVQVAGAGHLLPAQAPQRVAEELSGFLADFTARSPQTPAAAGAS